VACRPGDGGAHGLTVPESLVGDQVRGVSGASPASWVHNVTS